MWDEQSAAQVPVLETSVVGNEIEDQQVIVKFQAQSSLSSSGADVLTKLLTGSSSASPAVSVGAYLLASVQLSSPFRKIEPKPAMDEARTDSEGNSNEELVELTAGNKQLGSGRFLGINATRRGVKICPQCSNKIGYRAKQCKYCCPIKPGRRGRKPKSGVVQMVCTEEIHTVQLGEPESTTVDMVMVQNETEVSTSEEVIAESDATEQVDEQDVFIPMPVKEGDMNEESDNAVEDAQTSAPEQSLTSDGVKKYSKGNLQELIQSLLAQQENRCGKMNNSEDNENGKEREENAEVDVEEELESVEESQTSDSGQKELNAEAEQSIKTNQSSAAVIRIEQTSTSDQMVHTEVSYDANSVALFLGHLAQQNGKKMRSAFGSVTKNNQENCADSAAAGVKHDTDADSESVAAKYRRIQPKFGVGLNKVEAKPELTEAPVDAAKDGAVESKIEAQPKMLTTNATRRGVMQCQKCRRLIGCRSKICKFCKSRLNKVNLHSSRKEKFMHQAVKLQLPLDLKTCLFSVKKSRGGPDHRCFVRCEVEDVCVEKGQQTGRYSCDYPPCVTAQELGGKFQNFLCEHAKLCRNQSTVSKAKILCLKVEKLDELPLNEGVKVSLKALDNQCTLKEVPLVQLVSDKTLAVVDQLEADQDNALVPEIVSFVHVRFERIKTQGQWQHQVFCSGRSCIAWNPVFSTVTRKGDQAFSAAVSNANNCRHYNACLWAVASDKSLDADFRHNLMARLSTSEEHSPKEV